MSSIQTEAKMKLDRLLAGVRYRASLSASTSVVGLTSDSRQVESGQAFACLEQGANQTNYVSDALARGAVAALVEEGSELEGSEIVGINNLRGNLSQIAGNFYGHPSQYMKVVGVTGTNGKSSVCSWIEQLLEQNGKAAGSIGTLGAHACGEQILEADGMTTRDAVRAQQVLKFCRDAGAEAVAMEVSSHGLDQGRVESICFAVALFTNFSRDHLDYHRTEENYWRAKKRLFELPGIRCAVINIDDAKGRELALELQGTMEVIRFSIEGRQEADIALNDLKFDRGYTAELKSKWGVFPIHLPQMKAEFELSNLLAAFAAATCLGVPAEQMASKLSDLKPALGRMDLVGSHRGSEIYVDYAHTPEAVERVLSALRATTAQRVIAVLGCGGDRDRGKRALMAKAALQQADLLVITSDNPRGEDQSQIERDMLEGVEDLGRVECIPDRKEAIHFAIENSVPGSTVAVLGKGHESGQIFADRVEPFSDIQVVQKVLLAGVAAEGVSR